MDQGDIIRITDVQTIAGYTREMLNVYYYQVFTLTAEAPLSVYADSIAAAFALHVIEPIRYIQTTALSHLRLEFQNMTFVSEIGTANFETPIDGLLAGDYPAGNLTYSFRLQRTSRLTRNGRKSLPGVTDSAVTGGRTISSTYLPNIASISAALGTPIFIETDDFGATLVPVIVRVPTNPGAPVVTYQAVSQAAFRGIGTMNTRKEL